MNSPYESNEAHTCKTVFMKFLVRVVVLAVALWLTTLVLGGASSEGIQIIPFAEGQLAFIGTLLAIAAVFALVNTIVAPLVKVVSIPLYILTLGLFGLIINGLMLLLTAWLTELLGFGLRLGGFWWGVLAALIMSLITALLSAILRVGVDH